MHNSSITCHHKLLLFHKNLDLQENRNTYLHTFISVCSFTISKCNGPTLMAATNSDVFQISFFSIANRSLTLRQRHSEKDKDSNGDTSDRVRGRPSSMRDFGSVVDPLVRLDADVLDRRLVISLRVKIYLQQS